MRSRTLSVFVVVAMTLASVIGPAGPVSADPSPTCALYASVPEHGGGSSPLGSLIGYGARTYGCIQSATLTIKLMKDISWWPDTRLATAQWSGTDIEGYVRWESASRGLMTVYTEVQSSRGGKVQSQRVSAFPCHN